MSSARSVLRRANDFVEHRFFRQQWNCAVVKRPISVVAGLHGREAQAEALAEAIWAPEPRGGFIADPFGFPLGEDRYRILVEYFDWKRRIGSIATCTFENDRFGVLEEVFHAPTHLSYPFVLDDDGCRMMLPEHSEARDVSVYAVSSDGIPTRKNTIVSGRALIDGTIVRHEGRYWLFAIEDVLTTNAELNIFFASDLSGPWHAHALNPVKVDRGSARPAGTPFEHDGQLYRPGQDCSARYGAGVVINRVSTLTESSFVEEAVSTVYPVGLDRYDYALHTLSKLGDYTLIDAARKMPVIWPGI